jgi:hypothetical protein
MEIKNDKNKIKLHIVNARLPTSEYKEYYINQLVIFASWFNDEKVSSLHFGKQDIRGGYSITLYYPNHCCTGLKYFGSMKELISFIEGFNTVKENYLYKDYFRI